MYSLPAASIASVAAAAMSLSVAPSRAASMAAAMPASVVRAAFRMCSISRGDFTVLAASTMPDPSMNRAFGRPATRLSYVPAGSPLLAFLHAYPCAAQPLVPKRVGDVLLFTPAGNVTAPVVEPRMDQRASQLRWRHEQRRTALQAHDHALARVRRKRLVPRQIQHVRRVLHDQDLDIPLTHPRPNGFKPRLVLLNRKRQLLRQSFQHVAARQSAGEGGVNFHR